MLALRTATLQSTFATFAVVQVTLNMLYSIYVHATDMFTQFPTSHPTFKSVRHAVYAVALLSGVRWLPEISGHWGDWYAPSYCDGDRWVYGWIVRNEGLHDYDLSTDDTSLNMSALRFVCGLRASVAACMMLIACHALSADPLATKVFYSDST
jgi:hypothetical protein